MGNGALLQSWTDLDKTCEEVDEESGLGLGAGEGEKKVL